MPRSILGGLTQLYSLATRSRNLAYELNVLPVHQIDGAKIISIGNLRSGGSGKTPLAIALCEMLEKKGRSVALLSRGYWGTMESNGGLVSTGQGPIVSPVAAGDEAYMAANKLRNVMIRVGSDRVKQARRAVASGADTLVLDDGFQHRRLFRDLDLLMACPEDLDPKTKLLPFGPLRESSGSALRADIIIGQHADWNTATDPPKILIDYKPCGLIDMAGRVTPLDQSPVNAISLLAAIARPDRLKRTIKRAGFNIVYESFFGDHHRYTQKEIKKICEKAREKGAKLIVTTEKDLPRLHNMISSLPIAALCIDVKITRGEDILREALNRVIFSTV